MYPKPTFLPKKEFAMVKQTHKKNNNFNKS